MSRLTLLHINLIGAFVAIVVGVALYFTIITSAQDAQKAQEATYNEVNGRAVQLPTAQAARDDAVKEEKQTTRDYQVFSGKYMPTLGFTGNRIKTMMAVWWPNRGRSWPERFIRGVRNHMNREQRRFKVVWTNPQVLQLPSYGPDPNAIDMGDNDDTLTFGPYPFVVRCPSLQAANNHIRSWNSVSGLGVPSVEGTTLTGNSPNLFCSYNVRFTIILKEKIPPTDPKITGGGGGGAGGGMGGMMGGGGMGGASRMQSQMMGSGGMGGGASMGAGPMAAGPAAAGAAGGPGGGAGAGPAQEE